MTMHGTARSTRRKLALLMMPIAALLASGCDKPDLPLLPPAADVEAATEQKPVPTAEIVTDAQANARYSAEVESWGERVQAAAVRVCLWLNEAGAAYDCGARYLRKDE